MAEERWVHVRKLNQRLADGFVHVKQKGEPVTRKRDQKGPVEYLMMKPDPPAPKPRTTKKDK